MLLCGSFQNQVIRIIDMLRFEEKQLSQLRGLENANSVALDESACVEVIEEGSEDVDKDVILESDDEDTESGVDIEAVESQVPAVQGKDWRRVRKIYRRSKQYIFVAATLPVNGKQTAGGVLKRLYPDARWITGNYVHRHNPRCVTVCLNLYLFCILILLVHFASVLWPYSLICF